MLAAIAVLMALAASAAFAQTVNPDVTQETIASTLCVSGWTKTVRPSVSYTNRIKRQLMAAAGIPWARAGELELDHRTPIEIGGSPTDPANLWLQTWAETSPWKGIESGAHLKDVIETRLKRLICAGALPLAEAQRCIYDDWRACAIKHPPASGTTPEESK